MSTNKDETTEDGSWIQEAFDDARESVAKLPPEVVDAVLRSGTVDTLGMWLPDVRKGKSA